MNLRMEITHGSNKSNLGFYNEEPLSLMFTLGRAGVTAFIPMKQTTVAALAADSANGLNSKSEEIVNGSCR